MSDLPIWHCTFRFTQKTRLNEWFEVKVLGVTQGVAEELAWSKLRICAANPHILQRNWFHISQLSASSYPYREHVKFTYEWAYRQLRVIEALEREWTFRSGPILPLIDAVDSFRASLVRALPAQIILASEQSLRGSGRLS